jgi:hypothetical protein
MRQLIAMVVTLLTLLPTFLFGVENENISPHGRPGKYKQGVSIMCGIWLEDKIWNIAVTAGRDKVFLGTVTVEGDACNVIIEGLEKGDFVIPHSTGRGFNFKMKVGGTGSGDSDTVRFRTGPKAKSITFTINGGGDRDPKIIMIGKNSTKPSKIPFSLPAFPEDSEAEPVKAKKKK